MIKQSQKSKSTKNAPTVVIIFLVLLACSVWLYKTQMSTTPVLRLSAVAKETHAVYAGPNVNYDVIGQLEANTNITVTGRTGNEWASFDFKGNQGWIQAFFLEVDGSVSNIPEISYVPVPTSTIVTLTPTHAPTTVKTPTAIASDCIRWSEVSTAIIGEEACIYGSVYETKLLGDAFQILFSNNPQSFFLAGGTYSYNVASGDCVVADGKVLMSGSGIPYIDVDEALYKCEPWMKRELAGSLFPTQTPVLQDVNLLCKDTYNMVGTTVQCKIPRAYCSYQPSTSGSPTFCNDAPYPNYNFALVVWGNDWSDLDGRCIIVSGDLKNFGGKPQIEATSRSQVTYCQ